MAPALLALRSAGKHSHLPAVVAELLPASGNSTSVGDASPGLQRQLGEPPVGEEGEETAAGGGEEPAGSCASEGRAGGADVAGREGAVGASAPRCASQAELGAPGDQCLVEGQASGGLRTAGPELCADDVGDSEQEWQAGGSKGRAGGCLGAAPSCSSGDPSSHRVSDHLRNSTQLGESGHSREFEGVATVGCKGYGAGRKPETGEGDTEANVDGSCEGDGAEGGAVGDGKSWWEARRMGAMAARLLKDIEVPS